MKLVYEETDVLTQNLKVGDSFRVGDLLVDIETIGSNSHDEIVLKVNIVGAPFKKRSKMMIVIPKQLPITTLK